ncbi:pyrroline-5-carboxylate reductase [Thalassospira lucentensis]|uniref:pyrroline-5-carboxylate reductase n=1 Tax=Thalassospira lucentensis TaxID=168935 RepID=UPI0026DCA01A|nr:pyrroline-5-carboxylate reductase [Thalassospira lucentensis]
MTPLPPAPLSVLIIGCGNMGAAIAGGAVANIPTVSITAVDPDVEKARKLLPSHSAVDVVAEFDELRDRHFDVCIVSVKPQHVETVLQTAQPSLPNALVISIAAGIPLERLQASIPNLRRLVRVMPNLPALAATAMSVGFAEQDAVSEADRRIVEEIFGAIGQFCWLTKETEIDLATGVTGSGPGYVFAFAEYLQDAAQRLGFSRELAAKFARQTVIGAARLLEQDTRTAHDLKVAVTSPGGTTAAGLSVLEAQNALPSLLIKTTLAAADRAVELGKIQ